MYNTEYRKASVVLWEMVDTSDNYY